jgi:hypothetical protein
MIKIFQYNNVNG